MRRCFAADRRAARRFAGGHRAAHRPFVATPLPTSDIAGRSAAHRTPASTPAALGSSVSSPPRPRVCQKWQCRRFRCGRARSAPRHTRPCCRVWRCAGRVLAARRRGAWGPGANDAGAASAIGAAVPGARRLSKAKLTGAGLRRRAPWSPLSTAARASSDAPRLFTCRTAFWHSCCASCWNASTQRRASTSPLRSSADSFAAPCSCRSACAHCVRRTRF